ncbi:DUF4405 domain-containing protein [bacterium]|nr:DUF4405 domain-containing protein [bacterium]
MKERIRTNIIIDILLLVNLAAVGGIGFLMKYVLVPGSERWEKYGGNAELYLRGWDRHQWGELHLILSYIMLGLLALHLVFHWYQITCMLKKLIPGSGTRTIFLVLLIALTAAFLLFAFVLPVETDGVRTGGGRHRIEMGRQSAAGSVSVTAAEKSAVPAVPVPEQEHARHEDRTMDIYGSTTLKEVAGTCRVPADSIKKFLGIPLEISDNERLGRLRRMYDFHMSDIERYIEAYHTRDGGGHQ